MQVKRLPGDFVVHEVSSLRPTGGRHALYRLSKSGLTTNDAITHIAHGWNIPRESIQYAGLKDKHAQTTQAITILSGPMTDLERPNMTLEYLGQTSRAVSPHDIVANTFQVLVRQLTLENAQRMLAVVCQTRLCIPNYFDNQRFGSLGFCGEFIAHAWCLGNYERALYLALAEPNSHDRWVEQEQKEILRQHWHDWATCKLQLERGNTRSVITYLMDHPSGFKKAVALIRRDLRSLYVAAFQSKLWNEVVGLYFTQQGVERSWTIEGRAGPLLIPAEVTSGQWERWQTFRIPLPSGRKSEWPDGTDLLLDKILQGFQMQRHQLRFSYPRDVFFARGQRDLLLRPADVSGTIVPDADERQGPESTSSCVASDASVAISEGSGATTVGQFENSEHSSDHSDRSHPENRASTARVALQLQFTLPAAQYATMLIKALEGSAPDGCSIDAVGQDAFQGDAIADDEIG